MSKAQAFNFINRQSLNPAIWAAQSIVFTGMCGVYVWSRMSASQRAMAIGVVVGLVFALSFVIGFVGMSIIEANAQPVMDTLTLKEAIMANVPMCADVDYTPCLQSIEITINE